MNELAKDSTIEFIEPDRIMQAAMTPNDTRYNEQWHYFEATGGMGMPAAWDLVTGSGVVVAVLDTGITNHSDLNANVVAGYDFISSSTTAGDGNGRDSNPNDEGDYSGGYSSSWHGTHVAGTVAAVTNNSSGVAGVAFNAKIMPVRVLGRGGGTTSDIADAITWASGGAVSGVTTNSNPAEVINLSLGGSGSCDTTTQNAINGAVGRGTVVVIAAGNSNSNVSGFTPANCNNVVSVASNDREGNRASYSNYGALIDVTAPGGETATTANGVLSTLNSGSTTPGTESYAFYQGTSMAAPHVAGLVALMQSKAVSTPATVESLLKSTARALPGTCSGGCGSGIVQAANAINAVGGTPPPPPPTNVLTNGVAATGLSAATGGQLNYTMAVPAGATNLTFTTAGGTGDADMYVKFGSAPTTSSYDCRPYASGNSETCSFATPSTGTYYVMLNGYSAFSGLSLTGAYTTGGGGGGTQPSFFENLTDFAIRDRATINSPIAVSGRTGNAPSTLKVYVNILHTYRGDLKVDLVAPDGSLYNIHNRTGGSADNLTGTYTINASSEVANGTWNLRVYDGATGDTGTLDKWSLQF
ncbi:MAG: S8 family serine peptidase [Xanthomonadales bacterium]|nr:S8 family serine peptidase [Xanthomonadales bacterium]